MSGRRFICPDDLDRAFVESLVFAQLAPGETAFIIPLSREDFEFRNRFALLIPSIKSASPETRERVRAIALEVLDEWFRPLVNENLDIVLKDIMVDAPHAALREIHRIVMADNGPRGDAMLTTLEHQAAGLDPARRDAATKLLTQAKQGLQDLRTLY